MIEYNRVQSGFYTIHKNAKQIGTIEKKAWYGRKSFGWFSNPAPGVKVPMVFAGDSLKETKSLVENNVNNHKAKSVFHVDKRKYTHYRLKIGNAYYTSCVIDSYNGKIGKVNTTKFTEVANVWTRGVFGLLHALKQEVQEFYGDKRRVNIVGVSRKNTDLKVDDSCSFLKENLTHNIK